MDFTILLIGLGIIFYLMIILGTARIAVAKGHSGIIWFLLSLVVLPAPLVLGRQKNKDYDEESAGSFDKMIMELTQPFIDLAHTSRALFGLNLSYVLEGLCYFGVVTLLTVYFNDNIGLDDMNSGWMVGILTGGITFAMLILGATVDLVGLRKALMLALSLMFGGRILLALAPGIGANGLWNVNHITAMLGILGIILGYGIYQPAAYAGVKMLTNSKTAAMGYAMLYALMNLGGFLPALISPTVRKSYGITGVFWVYVVLTVVGFAVVAIIMSKRAIKEAKEKALAEEPEPKEEEKSELDDMPAMEKLKYYAKNFPIRDYRFMFFIFILIFVQTLFAHNWLTLPQYVSRAFEGFVSENFDFFVNLNPILIFILTPMVTALTMKKDTYKMMIIGTLVMALPTFILALGPNFYTLIAYLFIMTVGEAMWQPRFLQWVAQIAPKNMTGIYMGIGQFPWFLTKVITSLYSGWFLMTFCPENTAPTDMNTEMMWLIYACIAMVTPVGLFLAKGWMQKGFKTKHEG